MLLLWLFIIFNDGIPPQTFMYDNITFGDKYNIDYNPAIYRIGVECLYFIVPQHFTYFNNTHMHFRLECTDPDEAYIIFFNGNDHDCIGDVVGISTITHDALFCIHAFNCNEYEDYEDIDIGTGSPTSTPTMNLLEPHNNGRYRAVNRFGDWIRRDSNFNGCIVVFIILVSLGMILILNHSRS